MSRLKPSPLSRAPRAGEDVTPEGTTDARPGHGRGGRPSVLVPIAAGVTLLVLLLLLADGLDPFEVTDVLPFTLLLVGAAASAGLRFGGRDEQVSFSFTAVVLLAAVPLVGPLGAALLGVGAALLDARQGWWQAWALNGVMFGLSATTASIVYAVTGGVFHLGTGGGAHLDLTTQLALPMLAADAAFLLTNLAALLVVAALDPGISRRGIVLGVLGTSPTFLGWAVVAFVLVVLWGPAGAGPMAVLLVTAPLVLTRRVHTLFAAQRRVRSGVIDAMARSGRDDGGEAHGDRVLAYAQALAADLGLRPAEREPLAFAARLHGVGAAAGCTVDSRVDGPPGAGVDDATASAEVIDRVGFLTSAGATVRHAAEWYDGRGGPDGLRGPDIPLTARILAVADAADVAASLPHAAPEEVLSAVSARSGTRFDPDVVAAFARTLGLPAPAPLDPPRPLGRRTRRARTRAGARATTERGRA